MKKSMPKILQALPLRPGLGHYMPTIPHDWKVAGNLLLHISLAHLQCMKTAYLQ